MHSPPVENVSCIVVHHNSIEMLQLTIESLKAAGLRPHAILIVDNSNSETTAMAQSVAIAEQVQFMAIENRGYAAAINAALELQARNGSEQKYTLVSTHETLLDVRAIVEMKIALEANPTAAVAGPTLLAGNLSSSKIWSFGGRLTRTLKLPRHILDGGAAEGSAAVSRDWLDGALNLYVTEALRTHSLDESYFLYFEETDLHTRFRKVGLGVLWVPKARAAQTSSGIPPRLLGRNLFMMVSRAFSPTRARCAVIFESLRALARKALTQRGTWADAGAILRGWFEGERIERERRNR